MTSVSEDQAGGISTALLASTLSAQSELPRSLGQCAGIGDRLPKQNHQRPPRRPRHGWPARPPPARYVDGLSVREVAEILGRSLEATEALLVRAKAAYRRTCRQGGGDA